MDNISLVIPCYNEEKRLPKSEFLKFISKNKHVNFIFVNDGSTDLTKNILLTIQNEFPKRINIITLPKNSGKSEAVRLGMLQALNIFNSDYLGYFDADLSTPLDEVFLLLNFLKNKKTTLLSFGSRISRVGSIIERKLFRHFIGRIIATIISNILKIKIYDSQCGAKLFKREIVKNVFQEKFISKWLFDVEIISRILILDQTKNYLNLMVEVPLNKWIDQSESKVSFTYFFKIGFDLFSIREKYKK